MYSTDSIADMLTRIRNALMAGHSKVLVPSTNIKRSIATIMKDEGYIADFKAIKKDEKPFMVLFLKPSTKKGENPIRGLKRISTPGRRVYAPVDNIPKVLGGIGISILSTNRGVMTGKECRENNVGGEILCYIW